MADSSPAEESPAQRQARIRREKREKKILAGGNDRLAKISNVSGRTPDPTPQATAPMPVPDPSEPDIRTASYPTPSPGPTHNNSTASPSDFPPTNDGVVPTEADLRAFLRSTAPDPSTQPEADGQEPDLMNMLQQLMAGAGAGGPQGGAGPGGGGGIPGQPGQPEMPGLPPALAAMLSGAPGGAPAPTQSGASSAYLWKIAHAGSALLLAGYYILWAPQPFAGTLTAGGRRSVDPDVMSTPREDVAGVATSQGANALFYSFVALQILLQSSRLLLARSAEENGMVAKVAGFLPPPWGDRVKLVGRYGSIWTTLVGDAMCVVFVLGCVAWWSGAGA